MKNLPFSSLVCCRWERDAAKFSRYRIAIEDAFEHFASTGLTRP
jgi:hypothetical protein